MAWHVLYVWPRHPAICPHCGRPWPFTGVQQARRSLEEQELPEGAKVEECKCADVCLRDCEPAIEGEKEEPSGTVVVAGEPVG